MPELPEVETIRCELAPRLAGRRIRSVEVLRPDIVGFPGRAAFERGALGRRIAGLGRRGKYLLLRLDQGQELVFHLRLSGHLEVCGDGARPRRGARPRFERARFELSGGRALSFIEPRVLGRVYLVESGKYPPALSGMERMGLEPIDPRFDAAYLGARLAGRKATVKSLLLDQRVCCGVGNIYSDEALARARIRPIRPGGSLSPAEVAGLARHLRGVLRDGIRLCGTTLGDGRYLRPGTEPGGFQARLRVFGREGERCRRRGCRGTVERVKLGSRSSYCCPDCQV